MDRLMDTYTYTHTNRFRYGYNVDSNCWYYVGKNLKSEDCPHKHYVFCTTYWDHLLLYNTLPIKISNDLHRPRIYVFERPKSLTFGQPSGYKRQLHSNIPEENGLLNQSLSLSNFAPDPKEQA